MKPYNPVAEVLWKIDDNITAARRQPGWAEFHRACARHGLFFDNPVREGRRGSYTVVAFGVAPRGSYFQHVHVADGRGATVIEALEAAYRAAGKPVADPEMDVLTGRAAAAPAVDDDDFDSLLDDDDFDSLM